MKNHLLGQEEHTDIFFDNGDTLHFCPQTVLYGLLPLGKGTGQCEALDSYVLRLARAHRVSVGNLIRHLIIPKLKQHGHTWSQYLWTTVESVSYNGVGAIPSVLCKIFEELTSIRSIQFTNFHTLGHILTRHGLLCAKERYCQLCIEGDGKVERVYKRLLWCVNAVNTCPIHRVKLVEHICHTNIKSAPGILSKRLPLFGVCRICGSISYQCSNQASLTSASLEEVWYATEVEQFIAAIPTLSNNVNLELLAKGIKRVAADLGDGSPTAGAKKAGISKSVLSGWVNRHYHPNFTMLMNLCALAQASLVSVLKGDPVQSNIRSNGIIVNCGTSRPDISRIPAIE